MVKTFVALFAVMGIVAMLANIVTMAPSQRHVKLERCVVSTGQTYAQCDAATPRTVWDNLYIGVFR